MQPAGGSEVINDLRMGNQQREDRPNTPQTLMKRGGTHLVQRLRK